MTEHTVAPQIKAVPDTMAAALLIPALLVGLVLGLVITFKQIANPAATLAYAAVEGVLVGAISEWYAATFGGNIIETGTTSYRLAHTLAVQRSR